MKRAVLKAAVFLLTAVIMMASAVPAMAEAPKTQAKGPSDSTFVVKQNQDSPARISCVAKCQETARRGQADCNKESDPVMRAQCLKRVDAVYRQCTAKCPAK